MVVAFVGYPALSSAYRSGSSAASSPVIGPSFSSSSLAAQQLSTVPTNIPEILSKATLLGSVSPNTQLSLQFMLPLRSGATLQSFFNEVYNPSSPLYHHFLTPSQLYALYGPDQSEMTALRAYMQSNGVQVQINPANPSMAEVSGTVSQIENALRTQIDSFSWNGQIFYSATSQAQLPIQFSNIQMIYGLENLDSQLSGIGAVPLYRTLGTVTPSQTPSNFSLYYSPSEISQMYNETALHQAGYNGAGVSIAIVDAYGDPFIQQELKSFSAEFGLPLSSGTLHIIPVGPYDPVNGISTGWNVEIALDVEWAHAMAPNATINLYIAADSSTNYLFDAVLNATLGSDGTAYGIYHNNIISMSWGLPENDFSSSTPSFNYPWLDQVFQMDAALGMTAFASTGDYGAYDQAVGEISPYGGASYPSTDPYVTAVGGTSLYMNTTLGYIQWPYMNATGTYGNETGWSWNNYYEWGTGGGWSTLFGQPSWQTGPGVVNNGERGAPDVAWDADPQTGVLVSVFDSAADSYDYYAVGGTSVGSPCWAGSMALIDQKAGSSLGFINPTIYSILNSAAGYSKAFHDVTVGDNNPYTATEGWDPLTGVGSPNLGELANYLAPTGQLPVVVTNDFSNVSGFGRAYAYGQIVNLTAVIANNKTISGPVTATITSSTGAAVASNVTFAYNAPAGAWLGSYLIKATDSPGEWSVTVTAMNGSSSGEGYTSFTVGDGVTITTPPIDTGYYFQVGNYIRVFCHVADPSGNSVTSGVYWATFYLAQNQTTGNGLGKVEGSVALQYSSSDSQWEGRFTITSGVDQGAWTIVVNGTDPNGNKGSAYTWINVGLDVSPFTYYPTYVLGDTIVIFAYPAYLNGWEAKNGTFTAVIYDGSTFIASVPLTFTNKTGLGEFYDLLGLWKGAFTTSYSDPVGFYTITVNGTDEQGNYGSLATVVRVSRYSLNIQASLSNPTVLVQNGNESWILAKVTYPNGTPMTLGSVIGYLHTNESGADNSSIINWFPMTYNSKAGGFFAVNLFHAVNATETVIGNYTINIEAYDASGNYGNATASFLVTGPPNSFTALTVKVVDASIGSAIFGAAVQATGLLTYSATTNYTGVAVFDKVQVGDYDVSATATRYLPSVNIPTLITSSTELTIALQPISAITDYWPMFHHDAARTGYSTSEVPRTNETLWSYQTGGGVYSSPCVVDGFVYVGSEDGEVYALNCGTGALVWSYMIWGVIYSSPAVAGGVVYVGASDDNIYALNATTGRLIWSYKTGSWVQASPAVAGGVVYVGSMDRKVYALNATTGKLIWSYLTGTSFGGLVGGVYGGPAVAGGVVYVGAFDGNLYALNVTTGKLIWSQPVDPCGVYTSPTVADGMVFAGGEAGDVCALNALTGNCVWGQSFGTPVETSFAFADGVVYFGTGSKVYALSASTGLQVWSYATGGVINSSPAVAGSMVFVGSGDDSVYALNATNGLPVWSYKTGGWVDSSPAVVGSVVYVGSEDGQVYAFGSLSNHGVAVTSVAPYKTVVGQGYGDSIKVTVANERSNTETFKVTVYANTAVIASQNVTLLGGNLATITVDWNTTRFAYGNYTISANVALALGETNVWTGPFTYGTVKVTFPGDINGDGVVNGKDLHILAQYWLETVPPAPANVDIGGYGEIAGQDLHILAQNWLEST
jgi:subtilase family serine protease/outer membrane protein assembly factor BamB